MELENLSDFDRTNRNLDYLKCPKFLEKYRFIQDCIEKTLIKINNKKSKKLKEKFKEEKKEEEKKEKEKANND